MSEKKNITILPDKEVPVMELNGDQKKELDAAWLDVMKEAKNVVDDYTKNPSEMSGSAIQIHEDSPFVDNTISFGDWKKVVRGNVLDELIKKDVGKKKKK